MPGDQYKEIATAIADAFSLPELATMLREEMDIHLNRIVGTQDGLDQTVRKVLDWSEHRGLETSIIRAAYLVRPKQPGIRAIYEKYGMSPQVGLQTGGTQVGSPSTPSTNSGLEKTVKQYLPMVDVSLWREQMAKLEGRVCRIELNDPDNTMGTGFLVGPDAVLTNYHIMSAVIDGAVQSGSVRLRFDYKKLASGQDADGVLAKLHATEWNLDYSRYTDAENRGAPDEQEPTADELDYALIRLENTLGTDPVITAASGGLRRGWVRIPDAEPAISQHMALFIMQHPKREALKLALDTDANVRLIQQARRMRYDTTTEEGSSGAPVFNESWQLVGLHHYGDPATTNPKYNQGIPIGKIRDRLRRAGAQAAAQVLGGDSV